MHSTGLTPSRAMNECHYEVLQRFGAVSGEWLLAGEWWRLLTSCFVHIGALHLIGNLFALAMMGPLAELLWGRGRLLLIYLISGLAGSALAMTLRPDSILAGASGAIWGVQMSLFVWLLTFRKHLPTDLANDWFRRLCVVFALNAGVSFLPQVSWEGHLGGGIAGVMVACLLNAARFGARARRAAAGVALALLPMLFVGGLAAAMGAQGISAWQHLRERVAAEAEARALADMRQKLRVAQTDFNKEVATRLDKLDPDDVRPVEAEAGLTLARAKRTPESVAPLRAKVAALKALAEDVERHATAPPIGYEPFDTHRDRARAFAAARAQSFALLLGLLDAPGPVPVPARTAWETARREADQLWTDMKPK
ncbi:MAG: rhomboid family intramembrane serine protease [Planctomycetes bacterium]|nr:rhomboid family intramembrane serine protease [Planctomycetota bacterium]